MILLPQSAAKLHQNTLPSTVQVAPSAQVPTQMKTGPRYQTSLRDVAYRTGLHNGITVCLSDQVPLGDRWKSLNSTAGKKIKRRLEDLERRASSPEGSPEQIHLDLPPAHRAGQRNESTAKRAKSKSNKPPGPHRQMSSRHTVAQHVHDIDDPSHLFPLQPMRDCSVSPPPQLSYSYSASEPTASAPYAPSSSFQPLASGYPDYQGHSYYLPPLPTTVPSMPSYELDPMKTELRFEEDDILNQFNNHMPYTSFGSLEIPQPQPYQESNIHVNDPSFYLHSYGSGYYL